MLNILLSILIVVFISSGWAKAGQPKITIADGSSIFLNEASSSRARLFRGPSFNKGESLEKQKQLLRKQGFTHPDFIEMKALDAVDRNWYALLTHADRQISRNDYAGALASYDEILHSLPPNHLLARQKVLNEKLIAEKHLGYSKQNLATTKADYLEVRKRICSLEVQGYWGMKGKKNQALFEQAKNCLASLGGGGAYRPVTPQVDRCSQSNFAKISNDAKGVFSLACKNNFSFSRQTNYRYVDLALYIKDEDGNVPVIRTGYEVELYKTLKYRYMNKKNYEPLPLSHLFTAAIFAILDKERGNDVNRHAVVNVLDVLLTAHNVSRLLARPEQWAANFPKTHAGQNRTRQDSARPIFDDLMGRRSVDQYPTFLQYYDYDSKRPYFDYHKVIGAFYGKNGVFEFIPQASEANDGWTPDHWNGGMHYYFWVGALVKWLGDNTVGLGSLASEAAYDYEWWQKTLQGINRRGDLQLYYGFTPGVNTMIRFIAILKELEELDSGFVSS